MRLLSLHLEGFRSHADLHLDQLGAIDAAAIVGPNGAGKSSILVAVDHALYGTGGEELIRDGESRMRITLQVEQSGDRWRIVRGRDRGKSALLTLERMESDGWESWTRRTIKETQQLIIEHVTGMDAQAFSATVYAPQGQAGMLAALTPAKRKELLGGLLGLDRFDPWRRRASQDARDLRTRLAGLDDQAARLVVERDELAARIEDLEALRAQVQNADRAQEAAAGDVERAIEADRIRGQVRLRVSLLGQLEQLRHRAQRSEQATARRAELQAQAAELAGASEAFDQLDAQRREHDAKAAAVQAEIRAAEQQARSRRERIEHLEQSARMSEQNAQGAQDVIDRHTAALAENDPDVELERCPECGQAIDDPQARASVEERRRRRREHLETDRDRALEARDGFRRTAAELREQAQALAAAPDPAVPQVPGPFDQSAWQAARERAEHAQQVAGALASLAEPEDLDALRDEYRRVKAEADALPAAAPDAPTVEQARAQLAAAERQLADLQARLARADEQHRRLDALRTELYELDSRRPELDLDARALDVCSYAFGPAGIPALILDNTVGAIEAGANELLEQVPAIVPMRVALSTQREKRDGGISETLDIVVDDGTGEHRIERFSGGERYRVHLALRLGLARALASAGGPRSDVLLIDEITDLDHEGVRTLGELLATWPSQVLVVSHTDALTEALPTTITVGRRRATDPSQVLVT